jgi:hypothetical protein
MTGEVDKRRFQIGAGATPRPMLVAAALVVALALTLPVSAAAAEPAAHLVGGGTASISQAAMNVTIDGGGTASGSFECLMAGRSGFVLGAFGLAHNMIVHATPSAGTVNGSVVTFSGSGRLTLDGRQKMDVHVQVTVDVSAQTLQLTVVEVGALPVEQLETGRISLVG